MESRAKLLGHPIHPMLVHFPLGLFPTAVLLDVLHLSEIGFWVIGVGIAGGLAAAIFGLVDWLEIPRATRAKRIGLLHGVGNVVVVVLFATSWVLRQEAPGTPSSAALILSWAGLALVLVTGWLGGELVGRLGIGVDEGANVDAPSSLSGRAGGRLGTSDAAFGSRHAPTYSR